MSKSICGADCENCGYGKNNGCSGCENSGGCPFGEKCFIYNYIKTGGKESFLKFKQQLIDEFNSLNIEGMPKINDLFALNGAYINLAYPMPSGEKVKLLCDNDVYLGNQAECEFGDETTERCFGMVAGLDFLLVCEYGVNCEMPELLVYKRR